MKGDKADGDGYEGRQGWEQTRLGHMQTEVAMCVNSGHIGNDRNELIIMGPIFKCIS